MSQQCRQMHSLYFGEGEDETGSRVLSSSLLLLLGGARGHNPKTWFLEIAANLWELW